MQLNKNFLQMLKDSIEDGSEIYMADGTVIPLVLNEEVLDIIIASGIKSEDYEICEIAKELKELI